MVQIFLIFVGGVVAQATLLPKSLQIPCGFLLDGTIEAFPESVGERIADSLPGRGPYRLVDLNSIRNAVMFEPYRLENAVLIRHDNSSQLVHPTDEFGQELLRYSKVLSATRREVMNIFVYSDTHQALGWSDPVFGTNDLFDRETVNEAVLGFLKRFKADHEGRVEGYVKIRHVHPEFDVFGQSDKDVRLWTLSRYDLEAASRLSQVEGVPVVIEAISPNGYSYSAAYFRGENLTSIKRPMTNPLAHLLQQRFEPGHFVVTHVDHRPGPSPTRKKPIGPVPQWIAAEYAKYKENGTLPTDPGLQKFILRMAEEDPDSPLNRAKD